MRFSISTRKPIFMQEELEALNKAASQVWYSIKVEPEGYAIEKEDAQGCHVSRRGMTERELRTAMVVVTRIWERQRARELAQ